MAGGAYSSPYHFARQLSAGTGEPPVAMRRRVMLERAAWQLHIRDPPARERGAGRRDLAVQRAAHDRESVQR